MVKDVADWGDTRTSNTDCGTWGMSPTGAHGSHRTMSSMKSTCVYATVLSEKSRLQNPPGWDHTLQKKHHLCAHVLSCVHVHAHCVSEMHEDCTHPVHKASTLYSLYFLNNKNAIKIK